MQEWSKTRDLTTRRVEEEELEIWKKYYKEGNLEALSKCMSPYFTFGEKKGEPIKYVDESGRDITMMVLSLKAAGLRKGIQSQDYGKGILKESKEELFRIGKRTKNIFECIEDFLE